MSARHEDGPGQGERPASDLSPHGAEARGKRAWHGESLPLVLHVGHNAAYKNREAVLRVGALVSRQLPVRLVLAGPPPTQSLRRLAADLGIEGVVEWRCNVGDADLQDLYRQAGVFLFPSLYEGFGWPPLEAMVAGTPVVCSDAASLPEVVGDAALTGPPEDHVQLAQHCLAALMKPDLRAVLIQRGLQNTHRFSLERFAAQLLTVYQDAVL